MVRTAAMTLGLSLVAVHPGDDQRLLVESSGGFNVDKRFNLPHQELLLYLLAA